MTSPSARRCLVLGVLVALAVPTTALGHTGVSKRYPKPGTTISKGPKTVYVTFSQRILGGAKFTVKRRGKVLMRGRNDRRRSNRVIGKRTKRLPSGVYRVSWSARSLDGHKLTGRWSFRVR